MNGTNGTAPVQHRSLVELFPARPNDPVMWNWRALMRELELRLRTYDLLSTDWEAATRQLREIALTRLNEILGPAYERLVAFASLGPGWILARSSTRATLQAGQTVTLIVDDQGVQRNLFVSTLFLVIQQQNNPANFAVAQLLNYLPGSGTLAVRTLTVQGSGGPHEAWIIFGAPSAGITDGGTFP